MLDRGHESEKSVESYSHLFEHLRDELEYLDILVEFAMVRLGLNTKDSAFVNTDIKNQDRFIAVLREKRDSINFKLEKSREQGVIFPWHCLCDRFELDPLEQQIVLICLAARLDRKYPKAFSIIHDDVTKDHVSQEIILQLIMCDASSRLQMNSCFSPDAPLRKWRIIELPNDRLGPFGDSVSPMVLHSAIAGYLLGESNIDTVLQGFARIFHGEKNIDELTLDDELKKSLSAILFELEKSITPSNGRSASYYYFYGPSGGGKKSTASALCLKLGLPLLIVDVASLLFRDIDTTMIVQSIVRQAILSPAGILFQYNDLLFTEDPKSVLLWRKILDETARVRIPLFFTGKTPRKFFDDGNDAQEISLEFPVPETGVRARIWGTATAAADIAICQDSVKTLADRYRFTPGRILSIVKSAVRDCAKAQDEQIKLGCLLHRCSATLAARLPRFATKITSPFSWNDLVLPASQKEMLHDICLHVHHQEKVFGEWGFNAKVATGQGINALFTGFSGTGKTMAAGILAKALVQDIYKIDLSLVVSKYIGETEKNLSTIFNEVDAGQAILFFDEADALFGKRSNVKDAHDRYANIEVAYLLQKMEEYQGITILATNLRQNMDEAFARRMHYIIEFPLPDRDDRERLWRNAFPAEAPLESLDFPFLARQFSITGANIKNIALAAALRAAEKKERIAMPHVLSAVRREYKKTGSFLSEDAVAYSGGNA